MVTRGFTGSHPDQNYRTGFRQDSTSSDISVLTAGPTPADRSRGLDFHAEVGPLPVKRSWSEFNALPQTR